jgi:hypothetical protein
MISKWAFPFLEWKLGHRKGKMIEKTGAVGTSANSEV